MVEPSAEEKTVMLLQQIRDELAKQNAASAGTEGIAGNAGTAGNVTPASND